MMIRPLSTNGAWAPWRCRAHTKGHDSGEELWGRTGDVADGGSLGELGLEKSLEHPAQTHTIVRACTNRLLQADTRARSASLSAAPRRLPESASTCGSCLPVPPQARFTLHPVHTQSRHAARQTAAGSERYPVPQRLHRTQAARVMPPWRPTAPFDENRSRSTRDFKKGVVCYFGVI